MPVVAAAAAAAGAADGEGGARFDLVVDVGLLHTLQGRPKRGPLAVPDSTARMCAAVWALLDRHAAAAANPTAGEADPAADPGSGNPGGGDPGAGGPPLAAGRAGDVRAVRAHPSYVLVSPGGRWLKRLLNNGESWPWTVTTAGGKLGTGKFALASEARGGRGGGGSGAKQQQQQQQQHGGLWVYRCSCLVGAAGGGGGYAPRDEGALFDANEGARAALMLPAEVEGAAGGGVGAGNVLSVNEFIERFPAAAAVRGGAGRDARVRVRGVVQTVRKLSARLLFVVLQPCEGDGEDSPTGLQAVVLATPGADAAFASEAECAAACAAGCLLRNNDVVVLEGSPGVSDRAQLSVFVASVAISQTRSLEVPLQYL